MNYISDANGFRPTGNLVPERTTNRRDARRRAQLVDEIRDYLEVLFDPRRADHDDDLDDLLEPVHTITF